MTNASVAEGKTDSVHFTHWTSFAVRWMQQEFQTAAVEKGTQSTKSETYGDTLDLKIKSIVKAITRQIKEWFHKVKLLSKATKEINLSLKPRESRSISDTVAMFNTKGAGKHQRRRKRRFQFQNSYIQRPIRKMAIWGPRRPFSIFDPCIIYPTIIRHQILQQRPISSKIEGRRWAYDSTRVANRRRNSMVKEN